MLPVSLPNMNFAFASAKTRSTCNSVSINRTTGYLCQEKRLKGKRRCQLKRDRKNEWTSRAKEFESETRTRRKLAL
ncbi:hypothetical protein RB195_018180 [Necator americanus]|uniref:BZIP domain-containing protein n=1 Tax=Necator americanus TaxID=51031 RepID=A0ABR1CA66_NECAM